MKKQLKALGELDAFLVENGGEGVFRIEFYASGSGYIYHIDGKDWGINSLDDIIPTIEIIKEEIKDGSFFI